MNVSDTNNNYTTSSVGNSKDTQSSKVNLRNISQNEVNELIRAGILELSANTLIIVPDNLNNKRGSGYAMNYKTDLIKQTETVIEFNKSIGKPTKHAEKDLMELQRVQGTKINSFEVMSGDEVSNEIDSNKLDTLNQKTNSEVDDFLKNLTEKGALKFLAELDKEKIEKKIEEYRKELEEKYKDNPEILAKMDKLVEQYKEQLIEKMEERIKEDASAITKRTEANISVVNDMKQVSRDNNSKNLSKALKESEASSMRIEQALKRIEKAENASTPELVHVYDLQIKLGMIALGGEKQIENWNSAGVEITENTLLAAATVFNRGFKEMGDSGNGGITYNRHQIVINSQETPQWFKEEAITKLAFLDSPEMEKAFKSGALYYVL